MSTLRDMATNKKELKLLEKTIELESDRKHPSFKLIREIWGMTLGIAGISIPMVAMTSGKAMVIPLLAVIGAAISTAFLASRKDTPSTHTDQSDMIDEVRELRQNIADLRGYVMHLEQSIDDKQLRMAIDKAEKNAVQSASHQAPSVVPVPIPPSSFISPSSTGKQEQTPVSNPQHPLSDPLNL
jgi:hypothetical protein